ncbi:modifier of mdg4, putative [Pediculus humanus corporis]|uniref:Modifier of mdg4, putative n=1 Tax=Pediculus humanus subsp. corporis TaxID=121224 RepID=E0VEG1_PEDHC|nr:modifier of mdg4, putative [Pediculus humanus corporis]EEB11767.1 modifier of mdg4, putative [Pediculus humanus corporis]
MKLLKPISNFTWPLHYTILNIKKTYQNTLRVLEANVLTYIDLTLKVTVRRNITNRLKMENSDDQFSLKWNNFQSNLATGFHDLLQEEDMVDVTLAAEGKMLYAHKIILSVCSPYFKDLFKVNPCKHPIVILKDVGHQELADMLDFMYKGEASVRQEDLAAFLKLAETLKVKGLAGDKEESSSVPPPQSHRKPLLVPKKKKEVPAYEPEEDSADPDFNPGGEVKRKRKRISSPQPKTETTSTSATNNTFVPLPKQEIEEQVEFLDDTTTDPLVHFITGKQTKQEEDGNEFEDPNQEMTGDETHEDLEMTAGPSEETEQVPQGRILFFYTVDTATRILMFTFEIKKILRDFFTFIENG